MKGLCTSAFILFANHEKVAQVRDVSLACGEFNVLWMTGLGMCTLKKGQQGLDRPRHYVSLSLLYGAFSEPKRSCRITIA